MLQIFVKKRKNKMVEKYQQYYLPTVKIEDDNVIIDLMS